MHKSLPYFFLPRVPSLVSSFDEDSPQATVCSLEVLASVLLLVVQVTTA